MATKPGKLDQMKQSGEKLKEKVSNMASNAGSNLMGLIKNLDTTPELKLTELEIQTQKKEAQVLFFIFLFLGILVFVGLVFVSKTFRVYTSLNRLEIYKSNEISQKSIYDFNGMDTKKLRDFYISLLKSKPI